MSGAELLDALQAEHAGDSLAALYAEISELNHSKMYHELGSKLVQLVGDPAFQQGDELVRLYEGYISSIESKLRPLSLSQIAIVVSRQMCATDIPGAIAFLEAKAAKLKEDVSASALIDVTRAQLIVAQRRLHDAKELLDSVFERLSSSTGVDALVWAQYYRVLGVYHKKNVDAAEFYRACISYLAYSQVDQIPLEVQRNLSRDLGLAALTSPSIYSFGEILAQPIVKSLEGSEFSWLLDLLSAFNRGSLSQYAELQRLHGAQMDQFKQLSDNKTVLSQKIAIVALIELVWGRDPTKQGQSLSFGEIASASQLEESKVELLVMKALSLGLIKGDIDEVSRRVKVSSVEPRVLDQPQISALAAKLDSWAQHVKSTLGSLEEETSQLV